MTMASHFATGTTGVVDTSNKFVMGDNTSGKSLEQYQTADTLKWTWRKRYLSIC